MKSRVLRFGLAGGLSTAFAYVSFPVIYSAILGNRFYHAAFAAAAFLNVTVSFLLQKFYVFRSERSWFREYLAFWVGASTVIAASYVLTAGLLFVGGFHPTVANAITVTASAAASFLINSRFTFRSAGNPPR